MIDANKLTESDLCPSDHLYDDLTDFLADNDLYNKLSLNEREKLFQYAKFLRLTCLNHIRQYQAFHNTQNKV